MTPYLRKVLHHVRYIRRSVVLVLCTFGLANPNHIHRAPPGRVPCRLISVIPSPESPEAFLGRYHPSCHSRHAREQACHGIDDRESLLRWTRPGKPKTVLLRASLKFARACG